MFCCFVFIYTATTVIDYYRHTLSLHTALPILMFVALWRFGRFDKAALQFLGAALLIALAGYAWQGRPGLEGKPVPPPVREKLPDTAFAEVRGDMLGEFDFAAHWLTIADSYHRRGDTLNADRTSVV